MSKPPSRLNSEAARRTGDSGGVENESEEEAAELSWVDSFVSDSELRVGNSSSSVSESGVKGSVEKKDLDDCWWK